MNVTIRKATPEDAEIIAEISSRTFEETWSFFYKPDVLQQFLQQHYSVEIISEELKDTNVIYFITYVDHTLAGFAKISRKQTLGEWVTDRCIELCRIYVFKKFHDQKIGKLLMEKSIEVAKKEGMESLVLGVWENNHRAINFYKKFGFEIIGTHPFIVGDQVDTDWVMRKFVY